VKKYEGAINVELEDAQYGFVEASLNWDGSIDYKKGFNGFKPSEDPSGENSDSIYIHDIDDLIEKLQALKELGKKHFDNEHWE
jgi:hypothetical protein